jgi:ABC-2 type transport system permease protein
MGVAMGVTAQQTMNDLANMLWVEARKAMRSRMPLFTLLGFMLMPFVAAFFMIILKDPEFARQAGLISAKAQLMAGTADWPTFLSVMAQAVAVGGTLLFSLIGTWVFGREFIDGTAKDLLAVPVGRGTILLAKFIVVMVWSLVLSILVYLVALLLGAWIVLPQSNATVLWQGTLTFAVTALLVVGVMTPVAFFASLGRGYLLPMGITILFVLFANVLVVAGWGAYFPWAIPALFAGAGESSEPVTSVSYWIVLFTGVTGMVVTYLWWQHADQHQ